MPDFIYLDTHQQHTCETCKRVWLYLRPPECPGCTEDRKMATFYFNRDFETALSIAAADDVARALLKKYSDLLRPEASEYLFRTPSDAPVQATERPQAGIDSDRDDPFISPSGPMLIGSDRDTPWP